MTTFETSQGFVNIEGYRLNVTARLDTTNPMYTKSLVEKTVKMWLYVAKMISEKQRNASYNVSPEQAITASEVQKSEDDYVTFMPLPEPRVTVWGDVPTGAGFTVHSHSLPQCALDIFWARHDALQGLVSSQETPKPQNGLSTQGAAPASPANGASDAKSAQPTSASPSADGITKVSGKKTAATLPNGSIFELPIYQVKLRSKDDSQYYEVYTKYGSNLGQFPELLIYTDNEIAKTNGVLDFLGGFGLTPGKDKLGEWVLRGVVKDKGDKKNLYAVSIRSAA